MSIFPTHTCFDDAFEFVLIELKRSIDADEIKRRLRVVHGICKFPDGRLYAHAWVEDDEGQCIFKGIIKDTAGFVWVNKGDFYKHFEVQETITYTLDKALETGKANGGTTGPWTERYISLCSSDKIEYNPHESITDQRASEAGSQKGS